VGVPCNLVLPRWEKSGGPKCGGCERVTTSSGNGLLCESRACGVHVTKELVLTNNWRYDPRNRPSKAWSLYGRTAKRCCHGLGRRPVQYSKWACFPVLMHPRSRNIVDPPPTTANSKAGITAGSNACWNVEQSSASGGSTCCHGPASSARCSPAHNRRCARPIRAWLLHSLSLPCKSACLCCDQGPTRPLSQACSGATVGIPALHNTWAARFG
jgi:hypothetical protein